MSSPSTRASRTGLLMLAALVCGAAPAVAAGSTPTILAQMDDDNGLPPVSAQGDPAALTVKVDRLEGEIRNLTGQIEQLQFQNRKLTDDLRKVQQDVDSRFQELKGGGAPIVPKTTTPIPQRKSEADPSPGAAGLPQDASGATPSAGDNLALRTTRRAGDAFDPNQNPDAPGAPKPLGTTLPSGPLAKSASATPGVTLNNAPSAPLDLMRRPTTTPADVDQSTANGVAPIIAPSSPPPVAAPNTATVASLVPGGTRDEFNGDLDLYKQGQYDSAATGLRGFLDKYPRDRMVPDAVYLLGESYTRLGRHREAAEQYLRLSTDFSKAPRAPDALLKLGMALNSMGVREQACATYQEVTRRYPNVSTEIRGAVDRELKRARC